MVTKQTHNIRRGLSDRETVFLCELADGNRPIIGYDRILDVTQTSYQNARKIVERLVRKKWLVPLTPGKYIIAPLEAGLESRTTESSFLIPSALAGKKGCYIAYWTALNHYGFTEQFPFVVTAATTSRVVKNKVHGVRYEFITLAEHKYFGTMNLFLGGTKALISDREKTIVDALDHPEYCGGINEVAKCLWNTRDEVAFKGEEVSIEKIFDYSKRMKNSAIIKRLGYLSDVLEMEIPRPIYRQMLDAIGAGRSKLNPFSKLDAKINTRWNLFVNTTEEEILEAKSDT